MGWGSLSPSVWLVFALSFNFMLGEQALINDINRTNVRTLFLSFRGLSAMCINNFSEAYNYFKTAVQLEPNNTCVSSCIILLSCIHCWWNECSVVVVNHFSLLLFCLGFGSSVCVGGRGGEETETLTALLILP